MGNLGIFLFFLGKNNVVVSLLNIALSSMYSMYMYSCQKANGIWTYYKSYGQGYSKYGGQKAGDILAKYISE